jgi:hypothetical protein
MEASGVPPSPSRLLAVIPPLPSAQKKNSSPHVHEALRGVAGTLANGQYPQGFAVFCNRPVALTFFGV